MAVIKYQSLFNIIKILLLLLFFIPVGCRNSELDTALLTLDEEINLMDNYERMAEERATALKLKCICTDSDSARWEKVHKVVESYRHFNLDSMSRYISLERKFSTDSRQAMLSSFDDIYEMAYRGNEQRTAASYLSIDMSSFTDEDYAEYLRLGMEIFKHDRNASSIRGRIRSELCGRDTVSYIGLKALAQIYRKNGEYEKAMDLFKRYLAGNPGSEEEASALYNIAAIYGNMGDRDSMELYFAKSALVDIKTAHRDMQSLYRLALLLLEDKDFERASRYIDIQYKFMAEGFFYPRLLTSGNAISRISAEYISSQKKMRYVITLVCVALSLSAMVFLQMSRRSRKKSVILKKKNEELAAMQRKLSITDKIKENYVFRYMMLSRQYLGENSGQRLEFKKILSEKGPEELYGRLKDVGDVIAAEKDFYRVFDEAFLRIFPDFISQVNAMLVPEAAYDESIKILPTEIRILAVIRLGITSSPDIAEFLNCSLNTVYTYRGRFRSLSAVGRGGIEEAISKIQ